MAHCIICAVLQQKTNKDIKLFGEMVFFHVFVFWWRWEGFYFIPFFSVKTGKYVLAAFFENLGCFRLWNHFPQFFCLFLFSLNLCNFLCVSWAACFYQVLPKCSCFPEMFFVLLKVCCWCIGPLPLVFSMQWTGCLTNFNLQSETEWGLLGDSGGVVNSLDFCPASLKSLGCFYFRCVLSSQWKAVTVNLRILHCQL